MRPRRCPRCGQIAPPVVLTDGATRVPACGRCASRATPELELPQLPALPELPAPVPPLTWGGV